MQPPMPAAAHSSTRASTASSGTARTAQSTTSGSAEMEPKQGTPCNSSAFGLTPKTRPGKYDRFFAVRAPNDCSLRDNPTTATLCGSINRANSA